MARIIGTDDQYLLGPLTNLGARTRMGRAVVEVPSRSYNGRALVEQGRTRFDDYLDTNLVANVWMPPTLRGLLIRHTHPLDVPSLSLAMFPSQPTDFALAAPPEFANVVSGDPVQCLHAFVNTANHATDITSNTFLPSGPIIAVKFKRDRGTPDGMEIGDQQWRLTFGGGITLTWSRTSDMTVDRDGTVIARRGRQEPFNDAYSIAAVMTFTIYNLLGKLYIFSSAWSGAWEIADIGILPSAPWRMRGAGGWYVIHVWPLAFETTGYATTDAVDLLNDFPDYAWSEAEPDGMQTRVFPSPPPGTSATVAVWPGGTPQLKQFCVTLGGDGYHSPVVQSFQVRWDPVYTAPTDTWTDITPWVLESRETRSVEMGPASLALTLQPRHLHNGQTLEEYLGYALSGDVVVKFVAGTRYDDDSVDYTDRFYGIIPASSYPQSPGAVSRLELTAYDRWHQLNRAIYSPPCVGGLPLVEAVRDILLWQGFHPDDIQWDETDVSLIGITLNNPTTNWQDVPLDDWSTPPYLPVNGSKPADFLREVLTAHGCRLDMRADRTAWISRDYHPQLPITPALTLSAVPGADIGTGVTVYSTGESRTNLVNIVLAEGMAPDGRPIYAWAADASSLYQPGTPQYSGNYDMLYVRLPDISTQERLTAACHFHYFRRPAGWATRSLGTREADLTDVRPGDWLTLSRLDANDEQVDEGVYLTRMSMTSDPLRRVVTCDGEVRDHA